MKRFPIIIISLLSAIATMATQPVLVGHRGSVHGVENTLAAFINGAARYPYLECDVRMTADSSFVISHDESTKRLGGKLTVAESTLDSLLAENYLQKRGDLTYAGRMITVEDYLGVCKENNVRPLIELKWTPGINNNDQSMLPALLKVVENAGLIDSCIVLTSMKPCLEFIMKNYPAVKVQFLGGAKWKESLQWILDNKIDVDLAHTAVSADDVKMLHDNGLKVNVWTVDDPDRAAELTAMGVDFITTNKL